MPRGGDVRVIKDEDFTDDERCLIRSGSGKSVLDRFNQALNC